MPDPPDLEVTSPVLWRWDAGAPFTRVYDLNYPASAFNPGKRTTAVGRFHFFRDTRRKRMPVLYGAEGEDAAISETIFHDAPVGRGRAFVPAHRLKDKALHWIQPGPDLMLVELLGHGLRRLGLRPENLTDTEIDQYGRTVTWAQALHRSLPDIDGLIWISRQFNAERALVLFGDRVDEAELEPMGPAVPLEVGPGREIVDRAANRAGIVIG